MIGEKHLVIGRMLFYVIINYCSIPILLKPLSGFVNVMNTEYVDEIQRIAVEESPHGISLIFARDVILGFKTIFPIPLDIAASWEPRIAESPGEDPYLASQFVKAYVKGFHGEDLSNPTSMAACPKHLIGYGAAIGGRDYNTAIIHEPLLRNRYLFKINP